MANAMTPINQLSMVDVGETNGPNPIITRNGAEVLECFYGDGIWQIEHCPPPPPPRARDLNTCCVVLQKNTKHYYKAKIISKQKNHGFHVSCYVTSLQPKVYQLNYINFGFVMMTLCVVWEG